MQFDNVTTMLHTVSYFCVYWAVCSKHSIPFWTQPVSRSAVFCLAFPQCPVLYSWFQCLFQGSITKMVNKNSLNNCFSSDKSKRRTKTVKKSLEPKWNQTFMYSPVHRREFRERMLEITLWDQARVREEESEFLGEVRTRWSQIFRTLGFFYQLTTFFFFFCISMPLIKYSIPVIVDLTSDHLDHKIVCIKNNNSIIIIIFIKIKIFLMHIMCYCCSLRTI